MTVLDDKYRNCYIEFTENEATRDDNNVFVATLAWENEAIANKASENADLSPASDFWLAIVVSCYQTYGPDDDASENRSTRDGDPDVRYHIHGTAWSTGDTTITAAGTASTGPNATTMYLEDMQDYISQAGAGYWPGHTLRTLAFMEPRVMAHEIAHQFGILGHTPATLVGAWDGGDYDLDAAQINQIRDSDQLATH
jgi:hypothetical protein